MRKATQRAWSESEGAVIAVLQVSYWLAKEEIASMKYSSLVDLLILQGVTVLKALKKDGRTNYRHHLIVSDMQYAINSCIEEHTDTLLHTGPFISVMCDESTDISTHKELVLYAQTVEVGKVSSHFLKILEVEEVDADSLTTTILTFLGTINIDIKSISGFGSDGASVT